MTAQEGKGGCGCGGCGCGGWGCGGCGVEGIVKINGLVRGGNRFLE